MPDRSDIDTADENFKSFQRDNLRHAAEHFALTVIDEPVFGWRLRSIGAPARNTKFGNCWLRVVSEFPEWTNGDVWTGNADANAIEGIRKPLVLDTTEWSDWRVQRAEVFTLITDAPCSATEQLIDPLKVDANWWAELHTHLDALSRTPTQRQRVGQDEITRRIRVFWGDGIDPEVTEWTTAHGDLHWGNLTAPKLSIMDWEHWGTAPRGYDAATLLAYSLRDPDTAIRVKAEFADELTTHSGVIAQLHVISRLLLRIEDGDYPDLAIPLHHHARTLID